MFTIFGALMKRANVFGGSSFCIFFNYMISNFFVDRSVSFANIFLSRPYK